MKRYEPDINYGDALHYKGMEERPDGDYVLYSDLIAAGCLVPVPVGEECEWSISEFDNFVKDGILYVYISGIDRHLKMDTQRLYDCDDDTIVQPVRLVPLAELEAIGVNLQ